MSNKHVTWSRSTPRSVSIHSAYKEEAYEGYGYRYAWKLKGHQDERYEMVADRDAIYDRARRGCGWKTRKRPHQWEHNVVEAEKHERHRLSRACRGGEALYLGIR